MLPGSYHKGSPFILLFGSDHKTSVTKLLSPIISYQGYEKGLLDLESIRYVLVVTS